MPYDSTYSISVHELYKNTPLPSPDNVTIVGFRPPRKGELYISTSTGKLKLTVVDFRITAPRLIVNPKPKKKILKYTETRTMGYIFPGEMYWMTGMYDVKQRIQGLKIIRDEPVDIYEWVEIEET